MMPRTTIYSLRLALMWFVIGITLGAVMMIDIGVGFYGVSSKLLHTHLHVMLFGWLVQTIFAVAYWMLPRFGRERPRAALAIASIGSVNAASLVSLALPWMHVHGLVTILEIASFLAFATHAWPRVKAFGR